LDRGIVHISAARECNMRFAPRLDTHVVVVTSPIKSHPSTEIIWNAIDSIKLIDGFAEVPITVVCDGCRPTSSLEASHAARLAPRLAVHPCQFSKRGIVTDDVASAYEDYQDRLVVEAAARGYCSSTFSLLKLNGHHGFSHAVKAGLRATLDAGRKFALVMQHDRSFRRRLQTSDVRSIYAHFCAHPLTRYIGFPSGTSKLLASRTQKEYKLHELLAQRSYILRPNLSLQPSIFWYDSNHLVDASKALEIYEPYKNAPAGMMDRLGGAGLNRFRLRKGDFTEERFGVEQRNLLVSLRGEPNECIRYFDWFGSFMLEEKLEEGAKLPPAVHPTLVDKLGRVTYVEHVDARGAVPPSKRRAGSMREPSWPRPAR
jgi:hypothetical protein